MLRGAHILGHWSRTQPNVALSSGEAVLNAALKGACELLSARELLQEWGREDEIKVELEGDSTACAGTLARDGQGKQKHLAVKQLWLQERIRAGEIKYVKIPRSRNSGDSQTKHWAVEGRAHFSRVGFTPLPQEPRCRGSFLLRFCEAKRQCVRDNLATDQKHNKAPGLTRRRPSTSSLTR